MKRDDRTDKNCSILSYRTSKDIPMRYLGRRPSRIKSHARSDNGHHAQPLTAGMIRADRWSEKFPTVLVRNKKIGSVASTAGSKLAYCQLNDRKSAIEKKIGGAKKPSRGLT